MAPLGEHVADWEMVTVRIGFPRRQADPAPRRPLASITWHRPRAVSGANLVDDLEASLLRRGREPSLDALLHAGHEDGVAELLPAAP